VSVSLHTSPRPRWWKPFWVAFWVVTAGFWLLGITWSLPNAQHLYSYHPDEVFTVFPAVHIVQSGDWNPHWFSSGNFLQYLTALTLSVVLPFVRDADWMTVGHLVARLLVYALSVGAVVVTYFLGRRAFSPRAGLIAAVLLSATPLLVVTAHYAKEDAPVAFWVALTLLAAVALQQKGGRWWAWAVAGLAAGFAAGTKYNAGAVLLIPLLVAFLSPGAARWGRAALVLVGGALGFLACCPYALLAPDEFRRSIELALAQARADQPWTLAFQGRGPGWWYYAIIGLPVALGWPLYALSLAGIGSALRRRTAAGTLLLVWVVVSFLLVGATADSFVRYLTPLLPALAVLCGAAADRWLTAAAPARRRWVYAAVAVAWAVAAESAKGPVLQMASRDPRDTAAAFLARQGGRVGLLEPPWYRTPPVSPINGGPVAGREFQAWQAAHPGAVVITGLSPDTLFGEFPRWFVVSDLETMDPQRLGDAQTRAFLDALDRTYQVHQLFAPHWLPTLTGIPKRHLPPDWLYPFPTINVYVRTLFGTKDP